MECPMPQIQESKEKMIEILKNSKNIAIIGLSPNEEKDSNKVAKYLQKHGYKIFPIYPKEDTILGEKVYKSLQEIKEPIDIVNIFRKPDALVEIVDSVIKKGGIKNIWAQLGVVNDEAAKIAKDAGLSMVQGRCIKVEHERLIEK